MTTGLPAALETRQVSKSFRAGSPGEVHAIRDVSLIVPPGSFTLLRGPSGSGKTTLLGLLGGLERPTSGHVLFGGRDLSGCSDAELARVRRRIGFVFQDFALIPGLPVWENVTYPLIPRGVVRRDRHRLAGELLARVGMAGRGAAQPRELSGGEKQRVSLARALVGRPDVILADEPTSNLDDETAAAVLGLFREAVGSGATVVTCSHDPCVVPLATQICLMESGRLALSKSSV